MVKIVFRVLCILIIGFSVNEANRIFNKNLKQIQEFGTLTETALGTCQILKFLIEQNNACDYLFFLICEKKSFKSDSQSLFFIPPKTFT